MSRIAKTTAVISTAVLLGAGFADPASADSAWPDVAERAELDWTPGDGEPQPMDRSYFQTPDQEAQAEAGVESQADESDQGFFQAIVDAFERDGDRS